MTDIKEDESNYNLMGAIYKGDWKDMIKWIFNLKFRQSDVFKMRFDLLIMLFSLFNCFFVPVKVAFEPK